MANPKGAPQNLDPVRTKEEAKKRGAAGGRKSGEVRRKKRDARQAIQTLLNMAAKGKLEENLKTLGFDECDLTDMVALQASVFTRALAGDMKAYQMLMEYGGYNPDKKLRDQERKARIKAIEDGRAFGGDGATPGGDADDVVVYLPENGRGQMPEEDEDG